jgi:hypothetical protein
MEQLIVAELFDVYFGGNLSGGTTCVCIQKALGISTEGVRGIPQFLRLHYSVLRSACSARCCKRRLIEHELIK